MCSVHRIAVAIATAALLLLAPAWALAQSDYTLKLDGEAIKDVPPGSEHSYQFCLADACEPLVVFSAPSPIVDHQPVAAFDYTPAAPVVGQPVTFASTSTCEDQPCTYEWYDTNKSLPWGTGQTITKTFQTAAVKHATLEVVDQDGDIDFEQRDVTVGTATAPPPPPPSSDGPAPPVLTAPQTVTITPSMVSATPAAATLSLSTSQDYIIQQSGGALPGNVRINGGRNIIFRGMRVAQPMRPNAATTAFHYRGRGPQFEGFTGHLFIEDFRVVGPDLAEGIIGNAAAGSVANAKVTLYNGRCELATRAYSRSNGSAFTSRAPTWPTDFGDARDKQPTYDGLRQEESGKWWDEHGDCFQSWVMPKTIHIEKVTGVTPCQFDYLEPARIAGQTLTLKDVNVRQYRAPWDGSKVNGQSFWGSGWTINLDNVWNESSQPGFAGVNQGVPPLGDFVP